MRTMVGQRRRAGAEKAPATFASRKAGVNAVWLVVSRVRVNQRGATGARHTVPSARASHSLWL